MYYVDPERSAPGPSNKHVKLNGLVLFLPLLDSLQADVGLQIKFASIVVLSLNVDPDPESSAQDAWFSYRHGVTSHTVYDLMLFLCHLKFATMLCPKSSSS